MSIKQHIELLGKRAEDRVTGFSGIISTIAFDLYGCIQATIMPPMKEDGTVPDGRWYDVNRLKIISDERVMDLPNFSGSVDVAKGEKGPAEKPLFSTNKVI